MLAKKNVRQIKNKDKSAQMGELIAQVERGEIPLELIVTRLAETIIKLDEKEKQLEGFLQSFPQLFDITRKISELHSLHFPAEKLQKKSQKERFMAQILLGPVRKRK